MKISKREKYRMTIKGWGDVDEICKVLNGVKGKSYRSLMANRMKISVDYGKLGFEVKKMVRFR